MIAYRAAIASRSFFLAIPLPLFLSSSSFIYKENIRHVFVLNSFVPQTEQTKYRATVVTMAEPEAERRPNATGGEADEDRLAQFGYKQELQRDWSLRHNFGISFSIIVSMHNVPNTGHACCNLD